MGSGRTKAALAAFFLSFSAHALDPAAVERLAFGDGDEKIEAIGALVAEGDPKAAELLRAFAEGELQTSGKQVFIVRSNKAIDAFSGDPVALPKEREDVVANNRLRGAVASALGAFKLGAEDRTEQIQLIKDLQRAVDVLRAQANVDDGRIAYLGISYGGAMGALFTGIERCLKAAVLVVGDGGLVSHFTGPEDFNFMAGLSCTTRVAWFRAHVVNHESIHNHSAFARIEWVRPAGSPT